MKTITKQLRYLSMLGAFTALVAYGEPDEKPCGVTLAQTEHCAPCSLDQWAKKIRTLKEQPIEFSSLPSRKQYQENILSLEQVIDTLQTASTTLSNDIAPDKMWLGTQSLPHRFPEVFNLKRPEVVPAGDIRNFTYKPYAHRLVVKPDTHIIFFGDLHGSIHSLIRDLEKIKDLGYLDDNFKIIKKDTYLIFLGDYIDRGIYGIEVMYTLARLKIANQDKVILVRGNHEDYLLAPAFKKKHTSKEEKDTAPSFIDELYLKFDLTQKEEVMIFRFYETLPVVLYLMCGTEKHYDAIQCCHAGLEIGYDPQSLLQASKDISFEEIEGLWRKRNFMTKLSPSSRNAIKSAFDLDTLCADIQDFTPLAPIYPIPGTNHTSYLGFMWNDFYIDPTKTVGQRGKHFTGWVYGKHLTQEVLSWGSSPNVTVQGIFRAHQHNNETGGPMLNLLCCSKGLAQIWDDNVYTFLSAPESKLEDTGERCFTYDSFVLLKTASSFSQWQMTHYIQDVGMEDPKWEIMQRQLQPKKASFVPASLAIPCTEDLMREHGLLNRVLLIYEEIIKQIDKQQPTTIPIAQAAVGIIKEFIEKYHEKLEEDYIFPLFEQQKKELPLISTLRRQHKQGRAITSRLQCLLGKRRVHKRIEQEIKMLMQKFITMYRAHESREDTVVFPAVRTLVTQEEFERLGKLFEQKEEELFGKDGFASVLKQVEELEKKLGIYNLELFSPHLSVEAIGKAQGDVVS